MRGVVDHTFLAGLESDAKLDGLRVCFLKLSVVGEVRACGIRMIPLLPEPLH